MILANNQYNEDFNFECMLLPDWGIVVEILLAECRKNYISSKFILYLEDTSLFAILKSVIR